MMMKLNEVLTSCEEYISELETKRGLHPLYEQYYGKAKRAMESLKELKQGILFPRAFYKTFLDDFDVDSQFYVKLSHFFADHPEMLSDK